MRFGEEIRMHKLEQLAGATVDERTLRVLCSYPAWWTPIIRHPWAISIRRAKAWSRSGFFADFSITCGLYVKTPARIKRSTVCAMRFPTVRRRRGNGPGPLHADGPDGHRETHGFLHFALRHCAAHGKMRVILVLPFLTLTEQSQREYEKLVPHILADHSQSRLSEEERELASRWDTPFIIMTSVRFFKSLFAARPKDCRKLHSIAQSVILFDKAQGLPTELAAATMRSTAALCPEYGCTMVFSTATQLDFASLPELQDWRPREILLGGRALYAALRRTGARSSIL